LSAEKATVHLVQSASDIDLHVLLVYGLKLDLVALVEEVAVKDENLP